MSRIDIPDVRAVLYVIGLVVACLGIAMTAPMVADLIDGNENWRAFAISSLVTGLTGVVITLSTHNRVGNSLTIKQIFILTTGLYVALPVFGAVPFVLGEPGIDIVDAFFEAMSGLTTTGATVIAGLESLPPGVLLWRGLLQWFGGIGIIVIAVVFFPFLRVGGMQLFRWDSLVTLGQILPRAFEVTWSISLIYLFLTVACALGYSFAGMSVFDAIVHSMTTVATGGFANYDSSFASLGARAEYVSVVFMILASLPFFRYFQFATGSYRPLFEDRQVRGFMMSIIAIVILLVVWLILVNDRNFEIALRKSLFNGVSILTGTGYASENYSNWGGFPVAVFFIIGLVGGCAGSTCCSIKIFRFQLMISALRAHITRVRLPHAVAVPKYAGQRIPNEVLSSVMSFFVIFFATLLGATLLLAIAGLDFLTSLSAAAAALANIGPGLGDIVGPAGNYAGLGDGPKLLLAFVMLVGRLELTAVYALLTIRFWRS